jgi:hypothetical protein
MVVRGRERERERACEQKGASSAPHRPSIQEGHFLRDARMSDARSIGNEDVSNEDIGNKDIRAICNDASFS